MRISSWTHLIDVNQSSHDGTYQSTNIFSHIKKDIEEAVKLVVWPEGSSIFTIYPESGKKRGEGNGVVPIKKGFTKELADRGWSLEYKSNPAAKAARPDKGAIPGAFDCHLDFGTEAILPFVVEWETGNISSSHRAINRMALGILNANISGGILILPSAKLAPFLTDRIGNEPELRPYHKLWRHWSFPNTAYRGIIAIEHDAESLKVARIPKGSDGRALG